MRLLALPLLLLTTLTAQAPMPPITRLAELTIDPAHLDAYKSALTEEIEASLRLEPGVLRLLAVSIKGHPDQIRLFETYASQEAYQAHIQSAHFTRYNKTLTQPMIKSLTLLETDPILLGSK